MSLQVYTDDEIQDFLKKSSPDVLLGLQNARTYKLLPIYKAINAGSTASPTEITAIRIDNDKKEVERITLATDLIVFDTGTDQYLIDQSKTLATLLAQDTFFLEFKNGHNVFTTDPFLVKEMNLPITADMTIITADSTIIITDTTKITI